MLQLESHVDMNYIQTAILVSGLNIFLNVHEHIFSWELSTAC